MDKTEEEFDEEIGLYVYKEVDDKEGSKEIRTSHKEIKKEGVKSEAIKEKIENKNKEIAMKDIEEESEEDVNEIISSASKSLKNVGKRKKKRWIYSLLIIIIIGVLIYSNWSNIINLFSNNPITGNVVVVVNGEKLTADEFNKIYSNVIKQYPGVEKDAILNQTIDKILLLQEAKKENIQVSDDEVNKFIDDWLVQVKSMFTEEELNQQLKQEGITLEELKESSKKNYKESLMLNKLLNETIFKKTEVTLPERIRAAHILVDNESEANEILKELKNTDFYELAKEKSKDPSAQSNNGELGWFGRGSMVKEFEDAAFSLKIGEISKPVKTDYGYHIIKLEDKKVEERKLMSELNDEERNLVLVEMQDAVNNYIEELRNKAAITIYPAKTEEKGIPEITGVATGATTGVTTGATTGTMGTFETTKDEVCKIDSKPIIRLFSTTWCPHCKWIKETFDKVAKEYVDEGKIIAYHWELDTGDNTLTNEVETAVPNDEEAIFNKYNPSGGVPTFVFGCKYTRIGNGYESENSLEKEEAEFRTVIEELLK